MSVKTQEDNFTIDPKIVYNRIVYCLRLCQATSEVARTYPDQMSVLVHKTKDGTMIDTIIVQPLTRSQAEDVSEQLSQIKGKMTRLICDIGHFWTIQMEAN